MNTAHEIIMNKKFKFDSNLFDQIIFTYLYLSRYV